VTCFKGEFVLNKGIANNFIKRQEYSPSLGISQSSQLRGVLGGGGILRH
jgi:hypothetical protein